LPLEPLAAVAMVKGQERINPQAKIFKRNLCGKKLMGSPD
jgi:hypothetical protein